MKVLIDSDVCLDFLTGRKPHFYFASKLFNKVHKKDLRAVVSPDSFPNMFYILRRQYAMQKILPQLKLLRSLVRVLPLIESHIDFALDSGWNDFEDALQYFCAQEAKCDAIITRNVDDFSKSQIPVFTPFDFLEQH